MEEYVVSYHEAYECHAYKNGLPLNCGACEDSKNCMIFHGSPVSRTVYTEVFDSIKIERGTLEAIPVPSRPGVSSEKARISVRYLVSIGKVGPLK